MAPQQQPVGRASKTVSVHEGPGRQAEGTGRDGATQQGTQQPATGELAVPGGGQPADAAAQRAFPAAGTDEAGGAGAEAVGQGAASVGGAATGVARGGVEAVGKGAGSASKAASYAARGGTEAVGKGVDAMEKAAGGTASGAVEAGGAAMGGAQRAGKGGVEAAQQGTQAAGGAAADTGAKAASAGGAIAKGAAAGGKTATDAAVKGAEGTAEAGSGAAQAAGAAAGAAKGMVSAAAAGVQFAASATERAAGAAATGAKAGAGTAAQGAARAVDVGKQAVTGVPSAVDWAAESAAAGTRTVARGGRGAAHTAASALNAGTDVARRGVEGTLSAVQTVLHWWYLIVVQFPLSLMSGWLHVSWVVGSGAASAAGRGTVWFLDSATWAGEVAYRWLLNGMVRINRGMDGAIATTPPLVKGQLARAAVESAPQGPDLVDSLANKSPAQIGSIFRGLTGAAAAAKQDPLIAGGGNGDDASRRGRPDLVEQVNAALHAAFDRPDVPLEPEGQQEPGQAREGVEGKAGGKGAAESLRSVDLLRDRLVDQARLLVWHVWMVGRLQLTAAGEVAAVTRGMWTWLLRCLAHLAAAAGLLVAMGWAAAGGAVVAGGAWALGSAVRQLRTAATLEVRARRVWAPLMLRSVDTVIALASPLLGKQGMPEGKFGEAPKAPSQPAAKVEGAKEVEKVESEKAEAEKVEGKVKEQEQGDKQQQQPTRVANAEAKEKTATPAKESGEAAAGDRGKKQPKAEEIQPAGPAAEVAAAAKDKTEGKAPLAAAAVTAAQAPGKAMVASVQAPGKAAAAATGSWSVVWDVVHGVQDYVRGTLFAVRNTVQRFVPKDPEREEADAARLVDSHSGLSAVLRSSDSAYHATWRLTQASLAALGDMTGNVVSDVARTYRIPLPNFGWIKGRAAELAQDTAISGFARVAGHGPAAVVAGMMGASPPQPVGPKAAEDSKQGGGEPEAKPAEEASIEAPPPKDEAGGEGAEQAQAPVEAGDKKST
ncbi:hypothetical protein GPECTOR_1g779 [Gonium pectorale]|uniref:Uncharacterized protein n=1 Tax=Gonium pectorale TaxID=33097 RepID=A0A150H469_GONPE|nr:hypothetical protein GPECTOR_1g779 [Gonium pectorale]|eukprot:KXZ56863.1 hypothetical protein GPECTOR_1g779 [Gonium pectorale]